MRTATHPHPPRRARTRLAAAVSSVAVMCTAFLALTVTGAPTAVSAAGLPPSPATTGQACAPGVGVTTVVDFSTFGGDVEVTCTPGTAANGLAALANAGHVATNESGAGTVCTIDTFPTQGYPYCWLSGGYWSYWRTTLGQPWAFATTGAGGTGAIAIDSVEGWRFHPGFSGYAPGCEVAPDIPVISPIDDDENLPVRSADGTGWRVAVLDPASSPVSGATWAASSEIDLNGRAGMVRILAKRAGTNCPDTILFDATYDVHDTYSPGAGTAWSPAVATNPAPRVKAWATGASVQFGTNVNDNWKVPANGTGASDGAIVVLGDNGVATLTFAEPIVDGPGDDLVVVENGFNSPSGGPNDFLELGYLEVSSNGTDFVRFDSASRRATTVGGFTAQLSSELGGLAGKDGVRQSRFGTPFDLSLLRNKAVVRNGTVDLSAITHVRIVDIVGNGTAKDSFGRSIYDPFPVTGSAGFDLDAVGVLDHDVTTLRWLEAEMAADGGTLKNHDWDYLDYGLTIDATLALIGGGRGGLTAAQTALDQLEDHIEDYTTGAGWGSPDDVYAGATAKSMLVLALAGRDVNAVDGTLDLETRLRSMMQATGSDAGRFSDQPGTADYSNGFTQALAVLALSHTGGGVPSPAVSYLLAQQCPAGAFRIAYGTTRGCVSDAAADTDATAMAVHALLAVEQGPAVTAAVDAAVAYLQSVQDQQTGGFGGTGVTASVNANSSGLISQVLRAAGATDAADRATDYVSSLERRLPIVFPATTDLGAIAYNQGAFDEALADATAVDAYLDQWRRASAQAVLSYGHALWGDDAPDADAPTVTVTGQPADGTLETGGVVTFGVDDAAAVTMCSIDGGAAVACTTSFTVSGLAPGAHTVTVTATDQSGNAGLAQATWTIAPDVTAPVITVTAQPDKGTTDRSAMIEFSVDEPVASTTCVVDGASAQACTSPFNLSGLSAGAHTVTIAATDLAGNTGTATVTWTITPIDYVGVTPGRVLDTRLDGTTVDGLHQGGGAVPAGSMIEVAIAGRAAVGSDAAAVALNVTAISTTGGSGYVTVWPCDANRPVASSVNFAGASPAPNAVIARLSAAGTVCLFVAGHAAHVIADVNGYFPGESRYGALTPARLADTRRDGVTVDGLHQATGSLANGAVVAIDIAGRGGVPDDAAAVALNVTAVDGSAPGYLTVWPCDADRPVASSVNYLAEVASPNAVITDLAADGSVCVFAAGGSANVVVDVTGAFPAGSDFTGVVPARLLDTRADGVTVDNQFTGAGIVAAGGTFVLPIAGRGNVPADASAVVLNVTAVGATAAGYVTVWPCDATRPVASSVNFEAQTPAPNAVITSLAADGSVCLFAAGGSAHLVVDVTGYFP